MENSRRKHFTMMNETEISLIKNLIKDGVYTIDTYTKNRMKQRGISNLDIALAVAKGEVIEAHNNVKTDVRVLVRYTKGEKNCCVVVSLFNKHIVTCYWNDSKDTHETLNASLYRWNVNLLPILAKVP